MIKLINLSKEFGQKSILADANLHFPEGESIALIGPNGVGKSTLLKIICGEAEYGGSVIIPKHCKLGYLPQEPNPNPEPNLVLECISGARDIFSLKKSMNEITHKMENQGVTGDPELANTFSDLEEKFSRLDGYAIEAKAEKILVGLGFHQNLFDSSPTTLSGGWRMRLELAKIFINEPDFLILDEPTNHLDLPSLIWVEKYLLNFQKTLLFVSHDIDLLNKLATVTVEMRAGKVKLYRGNFDAYFKQKTEHNIQQKAAADQIGKKKKHMQDFVDRFGAKATKAKQAQSRVKMIEKLQKLEADIDIDDSIRSMAIKIPEPAASGKEILHVKKGIIGYGTSVLQQNIDITLERGCKVAIIGANGIGKSTFLKTLCGLTPKLGGEFTLGHNVFPGYFSQDQLETFDPNRSALDSILEVNQNIGEQQVRNLLGNFLFSKEDTEKKVQVLSGGEKSRLGLAATLVKQTNFLILDEPTNHLDMSSVEILIQSLNIYSGTLLFVSHSRSFINGICSHILAMTPSGNSLLVEGNLSDFEKMAKISNFPNVLDPSSEPNEGPNKTLEADHLLKTKEKSSSNQFRIIQKEIQKITGQQRKLEEKIESYQAERSKLELTMQSVDPTNFTKLSETQATLNSIDAKIEEQEALWLEAEEKKAQLENP